MAHGVSVNEVPTGVVPAVRVTAGLPVYVGTAPITAGDLTFVNKVAVAYTLAEAVAKVGPITSDFDKWTLHEAVKAHFSVYSVGPIVLVNVLDPTKSAHKATATNAAHIVGTDGTVELQTYGAPDEAVVGIIKSTVVIKKAGVTKTLNTDYTLAFDSTTGATVLSIVDGGAFSVGDTLTATFDYLDPSGVVAADIIGSYSAGVYTGLELVEQVYPKLRLVPGFLLAPKWSQNPTVAARMATIANSINGAFRAMALVDLSTDAGTIASYADAAAWKSTNGFDSVDMAACWPKVKNGTDVYHLSTVLACVANLTDSARSGVPYASPSNQSLTGTSAVLDDGTEALLTKPQANSLNSQGIVTALNGFNGWRVWGNRTAGYPGTTDPKDAFIPIRRMFNWITNTIILTTDRDVDQPGNRRLIDSVVGTVQSFINGLIATGALVDGKIEFRTDDNPTVDLADGIIRFHLTLTPPSPAESIEFTAEYNPNALAALFT